MFASHVAKKSQTHTIEARSTTIAICKSKKQPLIKANQKTAKLKKPVKTDRYYS
jgi:hypothetical protein